MSIEITATSLELVTSEVVAAETEMRDENYISTVTFGLQNKVKLFPSEVTGTVEEVIKVAANRANITLPANFSVIIVGDRSVGLHESFDSSKNYKVAFSSGKGGNA
jgi:hypothetical protein